MPYSMRSGRWKAQVVDLGMLHRLGTFDSFSEAQRVEWQFKIDNGIPIQPGRASAEARRILDEDAFQAERQRLMAVARNHRNMALAATKKDLPKAARAKGMDKVVERMERDDRFTSKRAIRSKKAAKKVVKR